MTTVTSHNAKWFFYVRTVFFLWKQENICVAITAEEQSYHSIILSCCLFSSVHIEENNTKNSLFIFPVSHNATISVPGSWQMAGQVSVSFIFHYQSVYQFRMSFLHSKTSWACQKWMTRKNRWGYLWTSSQIVVRWRYTLTFPPRDRLHRIVWFLILYTFPLIGKSGEKCLPSKHYSPKNPMHLQGPNAKLQTKMTEKPGVPRMLHLDIAPCNLIAAQMIAYNRTLTGGFWNICLPTSRERN